ncbi:Cwf15/Cwc15 cell cycle control family protein [Geopyxis carbonaria]|nr:Cwf15/Cwc15 cell cycle control family protein [Geopyxis carbonaria]
MTTAHRPTFDPARGKELPKGPAYHQRLLPAHTKLKVRQPGQGGDADEAPRDLRAELLKAEAAHRAKITGASSGTTTETAAAPAPSNKRAIEDGDVEMGSDGDAAEKRRKVLEETRDIDADSDGGGAGSDGGSDSSDDDSDDEDEEDETAELLRELEKIKKERAETREREEREKAAEEESKREFDIARGNPLLNPKSPADFNIKRRWDDDVIFKNQARGTDDRNKKKEFVNDLLRSDFHKKFMSKYVR